MARAMWLKFPMGASEWTVFAADPDDPALDPEREGDDRAEGCTLAADCVIVINRKLPARRRGEVLLHEIEHAAFHMSGAPHSLRLSGHREEQIIGTVTPMRAHALVGAGLLRLPRFPR